MHAYVFVSVQIYASCGMIATGRLRKLEYGSLSRIKKRRKHNWFSCAYYVLYGSGPENGCDNIARCSGGKPLATTSGT